MNCETTLKSSLMYLSLRRLRSRIAQKKSYIVVKSHIGRAALVEAKKKGIIPMSYSVNLKVLKWNFN